MNNTSPGLLFAFEGIDGSGKTTLTKKLNHALIGNGIKTLLTKEPGGTTCGQQIRAFVQQPAVPLAAKAEFLLFAADRAQHIEEIIKPTLQQNVVIICDRMADSSVAYQGYGRGLDINLIISINNWILQGLRPNLTFYLKLDYQTAHQRVCERKELPSTFDQEQEQFFNRVIRGYETLYHQRNDVVIIDAHKPIEESLQQIYTTILAYQAGTFCG